LPEGADAAAWLAAGTAAGASAQAGADTKATVNTVTKQKQE